MILSSESTTLQEVRSRTRPATRPCGVFVPENYEPNYAYPLVVWLHDAGRSERDIVDVLPHISMRNYLGLALRGTAPADPRVDNEGRELTGYRWSRSQRMRLMFQDELYASVRQMRQDFHIHTERVFLAGRETGPRWRGRSFWHGPNGLPDWPCLADSSPGGGVRCGTTATSSANVS